jgi:hypothetical protein
MNRYSEGNVDQQNLLGTTCTLDHQRVKGKPILEPGLLSKSGYTIVDDSYPCPPTPRSSIQCSMVLYLLIFNCFYLHFLFIFCSYFSCFILYIFLSFPVFFSVF